MSHDNHRIDIDFELAPPDRLDAYHRRQLSAMLDGELSPDQARFMLRRLQHDHELAARWERWQVCGDVLRGRGHALLPADFSSRVAAAIAAPREAGAAQAAAVGGGVQAHRLLRWGGGALAASVAVVALLMARQLPDPQAPALVEAASVAKAAPALVQPGPAGPAPVPGDHVQGGGDVPSSAAAVAAIAAAAPAIAAAEVPRRAAERAGSRGQSQRAALRRSRAADAPERRVASVVVPAPVVSVAGHSATSADALPGLALAGGAGTDGDILFGTLPGAAPRPWPRAVLPGLSSGQPFAAGYGLPRREDAFAPFQPRLETAGERAARRALPPDAAAPGGPAPPPEPARAR